jgi:osmotically-inducible protein OsmY
MKKLTPFLLGSLLFFGAVACEDNTARTSDSAPSNPNEAAEAPDARATETAQQDAQSQTRRDQLNADIRAREERDKIASGGDANRAASDLASEVRSKLEANIPGGALTVEAEDTGVVTVGGTVNNQDQLNKIEPLAKEIRGVTQVVVKAAVAPPAQ